MEIELRNEEKTRLKEVLTINLLTNKKNNIEDEKKLAVIKMIYEIIETIIKGNSKEEMIKNYLNKERPLILENDLGLVEIMKEEFIKEVKRAFNIKELYHITFSIKKSLIKEKTLKELLEKKEYEKLIEKIHIYILIKTMINIILFREKGIINDELLRIATEFMTRELKGINYTIYDEENKNYIILTHKTI